MNIYKLITINDIIYIFSVEIAYSTLYKVESRTKTKPSVPLSVMEKMHKVDTA